MGFSFSAWDNRVTAQRHGRLGPVAEKGRPPHAHGACFASQADPLKQLGSAQEIACSYEDVLRYSGVERSGKGERKEGEGAPLSDRKSVV